MFPDPSNYYNEYNVIITDGNDGQNETQVVIKWNYLLTLMRSIAGFSLHVNIVPVL